MSKLWLYHATQPQGLIVEASQAEELKGQGWVNSPALLDLPKENENNITAEQVENARPEDIINLVKSMGFFVLSDLELEAEINKASLNAVAALTDEQIIAEAERRGLKKTPLENEESADQTVEELRDQFDEDPYSLTKEQHVTLGNSLYSLGLRSNMKEETLIEKIKAAMNASV